MPSFRPGAFSSMFLVTRPHSFSLKSKKKKKRKTPGDVKINLKVVDLASRSATAAQDFCMSHLQLTGRLQGYCEEEGEELLLLRSLIEVDDRINISNRSLFKKHDACHSCTFVKALSKFQRRLAMIKRQPFARSYAVWSRKNKSHFVFC